MEFDASWGIKLPKFLRPDGRNSFLSIRNIRCTLGVLNNSEGSCDFSLGETRALCAIQGPKSYSSHFFSSIGEKSNIQIVVRPLIGIGSFLEKYIESCVSSMVNVLFSHEVLYGTSTRIIIQVMGDEGGLISVIQNSVMGAILDAGIPVKSTLLTVPIISRKHSCTDVHSSIYFLDPTYTELESNRDILDIHSFYAVTVDVFNERMAQIIPELYASCLYWFTTTSMVVKSEDLQKPGLKTHEFLAISLGCSKVMIKFIRDAVKKKMKPLVTNMYKYNNNMYSDESDTKAN